MMEKFDYIVIGGGCSGLSLIMHWMEEPFFSNKKILLIEQEPKTVNDRTWCFWEEGAGFFEDIVAKKWTNLTFKHPKKSIALNIGSYTYKMIKGLDFYAHCYNTIKQQANIHVLHTKVNNVVFENSVATIVTDQNILKVDATAVFSSVLLRQQNYNAPLLWQHFKGLTIETEAHCFNPEEAVFMDFSIPQHNYPAAFMYVLPSSSKKALVEYTIFSDTVLEPAAYDEVLKNYIAGFSSNYTVLEQELGAIPMDASFKPPAKNNIHYIGTAGTQTKASTGYTFQFIQQHSRLITEALARGLPLSGVKPSSRRFTYYDSIFLDVLANKEMSGQDIFFRLFDRVSAQKIFRFLDNKTTFKEELVIMNSMPWSIFVPPALKYLVTDLK